ncbi:hypothetical protein X801_03816, partial [Opisthorchis viverrini]
MFDEVMVLPVSTLSSLGINKMILIWTEKLIHRCPTYSVTHLPWSFSSGHKPGTRSLFCENGGRIIGSCRRILLRTGGILRNSCKQTLLVIIKGQCRKLAKVVQHRNFDDDERKLKCCKVEILTGGVDINPQEHHDILEY